MPRRVSRFCFLGGSTREECAGAGWSKDCPEAALVGYYPEIFPYGHEAPGAPDIVVVDLPVAAGGADRVFCVYFRKRITRRFWNVLCFAYSTCDWTLQERLSCLRLTPDQWYDVAMLLKETDTELPLPAVSATPVEWDGEGMYVENYPLYDGTLLTTILREGDWKDLLELHPKPETAPARLDNGGRAPQEGGIPFHAAAIVKEMWEHSPRKWILVIIAALLLALGAGYGVKLLRERAARQRQKVEVLQTTEAQATQRQTAKPESVPASQ